MDQHNLDSTIHDFDDLANWFVEMGSHFSPSELHGAIIGALSGGLRVHPQEWRVFICDTLGRDAGQDMSLEQDKASPGLSDGQEDVTKIAAWIAQELRALSESEMSFQPYLPDEDVGLAARTDALGAWCKGFLAGFAESQLMRARQGVNLPQQYPEAVQEALQDLTEIAKVTFQQQAEGADDDAEGWEDAEFDDLDDPLAISLGNEPDADDELAESDFMQVSEHVRLTVLTVFTEHGWVEVFAQASQTAEKTPPSLH